MTLNKFLLRNELYMVGCTLKDLDEYKDYLIRNIPDENEDVINNHIQDLTLELEKITNKAL